MFEVGDKVVFVKDKNIAKWPWRATAVSIGSIGFVTAIERLMDSNWFEARIFVNFNNTHYYFRYDETELLKGCALKRVGARNEI